MFPNPQDALPLAQRPNLERYKKLAKELTKTCRAGDPDALHAWAENWIEALVKWAHLTIEPWLPVRIDRWIDEIERFAQQKLTGRKEGHRCTLAEAQFVIARSHGFESWPKFAKHVEESVRKGSTVSNFEAAADAIVAGDEARLKRLLRADPKLVRARSTREHRASLLHYVSANGVEGYRQKTPKNAVRIAEILLKAGAEVNAEADVYGSGCMTLGLVATSVHPKRAGVQEPLMQILLDRGAIVDRPGMAGRAHGIVSACFANGQPEAAEFLAQRGAQVDFEGAAALGWLNVVKSYFQDDGKLKSSVTKEQMQSALWRASGYGRNNVVELLLQKGIDIAAQDANGQTAMHWAAIGGHLDTIKLLLRQNPPLEVRNGYGGTVMGQTLWSAAHGGAPDEYGAIIETLVAAGATLPKRHPPVNSQIDRLLKRHGSVSDPALWWYGEKPRRARFDRRHKSPYQTRSVET